MECFKMLKLESKTVTLCRYNPILENPTDTTRKLIDLINELVSCWIQNAQKSVAFLYTNNEKSEREEKDKIRRIVLKIMAEGEGLRWRRNRMGRPLSPPQIHQKNI